MSDEMFDTREREDRLNEMLTLIYENPHEGARHAATAIMQYAKKVEELEAENAENLKCIKVSIVEMSRADDTMALLEAENARLRKELTVAGKEER